MALYDVIIVGGGPAGLNAALVLGRCRYKILLLDSNQYRNAPSSAMHGFLSRDGFAPKDLRRVGREQLAPYGVEIRDAIVVNAKRDDGQFWLSSDSGDVFSSRKLLLATGIIDNLPELQAFEQYYGTSAFHCPYCDGWENRDKRILAYAKGKDAATYALNLRIYTEDLVLCTGGAAEFDSDEKARLARYGIRLVEAPIAALEGTHHRLERVMFGDGHRIERDVLFFHLGQKQRSDLAAQLGCEVSNEAGAQAGERCETNIPGLYIAGDATRDVQQVIVAAAEGAMAAFAINIALCAENYA